MQQLAPLQLLIAVISNQLIPNWRLLVVQVTPLEYSIVGDTLPQIRTYVSLAQNNMVITYR